MTLVASPASRDSVTVETFCRQHWCLMRGRGEKGEKEEEVSDKAEREGTAVSCCTKGKTWLLLRSTPSVDLLLLRGAHATHSPALVAVLAIVVRVNATFLTNFFATLWISDVLITSRASMSTAMVSSSYCEFPYRSSVNYRVSVGERE